MLNAERFKEEILNIVNDDFYISVNKNNPNGVSKCGSFPCTDCMFSKLEDGKIRCTKNRMNWLLSEYKEPIKVSKLEYDILKYLSDNTVHMYIVRDGNGNICLYDAEPKKSGNGDWWVGCGVHGMVMFDKLFQFIKWEDSTPTLIKDVLENCEVVNDAEE